MLSRLELVGFKSFADKTALDFAPGITAVVGPNGSGKSNVVDAVRWVLGEQSAKSLRGGEMADVIFTGSSTRKSLGLAEVTLHFDNRSRRLSYDGDEVVVTRRVYRDGQGEYELNGRAARLKDVKDLFLGSGAGTGAYCILEQGRVDALLSASPADRRAIFEEAAGISRFKAKKAETLRKLERVDADLTRVKDLLGEQEKVLRTLAAQASKAIKYQEYQGRLKELKLGVAAAEYAAAAAGLAESSAEWDGLRTGLTEADRDAAAHEAVVTEREAALAAVEAALRGHEKGLAAAKERIAAADAGIRAGRDRAESLHAERLAHLLRRTQLAVKVAALTGEVAAAGADVDAAARQAAEEQAAAVAAGDALADVSAAVLALTRKTQADRDEQFHWVGAAAKERSGADATKKQADRLRSELARKAAEAARQAAEAEGLARGLADLTRDDADVKAKRGAAKERQAGLVFEQAEYRRRADALQPDLDANRERRSATRGRCDVLSALEAARDGLGAGVRAVLAAPPPGVLGVVADLISAPSAIAPLVDLALGDGAQRVVVTDLAAVLAAAGALTGRVSFLPLAGPRVPDASPAEITSPVPGLVAQLFDRVRFVATLDEARALTGYRCVTRAGEVVDADGTVTVGPAAASGFVSRKAELRDLRADLDALDERIAVLEVDQADLRERADGLASPLAAAAAEVAALEDAAGTLRDRIAAQSAKHARLADAAELAHQEAALLRTEADAAEMEFRAAAGRAEEAERAAADVAARLAADGEALTRAAAEKDEKQRANTAAQVALSRTKQHLAGLTAKAAAVRGELAERSGELAAAGAAAGTAAAALAAVELDTLRTTAAAAAAHADKDAHGRAVFVLAQDRDAIRAARDAATQAAAAGRAAWKDRQEAAHAAELRVKDWQNRKATVEGRVREEFALEIAAYVAPDAGGAVEDGEPLPPDEEIDELKKKIAKLGGVNLEAVEHLTAEQAREADVRRQYDDLSSAEGSLLEIIEQINADSRTLFADTLAAVRGQFQELFRKLFGGGQADIVLDGDDVLEAGIDVTARPPGKELRSLMLLSGGEKTLTAVALLLAIFKSKPSPFCILDEVDAALDEANAVRLAGLLQEFKGQSQFIVITHKKRTMAAADVLHGITMQESGISKRVALRFEDWPDDAKAAA